MRSVVSKVGKRTADFIRISTVDLKISNKNISNNYEQKLFRTRKSKIMKLK